ncbi:Spo0E family sporulation regulatory protein-aspartic acid phosphatase [uncultured Clostridium sp.]|uniref:Spo0E family sporulation regulatory protein-aspartic acid phosphatase n=1 Tax=uncultured Clostridium sp. TaxID=59620 RepID=UPI0028E36A67|nr:Spo0E family sporulation regulatory protein-aspartic acid phosphatase [uncultured Clostridium sp.]
MDEILYNLDIWRDLLYNAIGNNKDLNSDVVLEISKILDDIIIEAYKEQLNINNK